MPATHPRLIPLLFAVLAAVGCAGLRSRPETPAGAAVDAPSGAASEAGAGTEQEGTAGSQEGGPAAGPPSTLDLVPPEPEPEDAALAARGDPCEVAAAEGETIAGAARRTLYETVCGASLWFDGLFGEQRDEAAARRASGRLETSVTQSEYWGTRVRVRFNARLKLPNLQERAEVFAGRDDDTDFVEDRTEGFALRSQFRDIELEDRWVAGLGYSLPGSYQRRTDFRLGLHGGRTPDLFVQARHRRNWYPSELSLWHLRETAFWNTRDGFGVTAGLDFGHLLSPTTLFRISNVGTFSEGTDGLDYRSALVAYRNLERRRALALESYVRGQTDDEIPVREYGLRAVFRRPLRGSDWLFGELIGGYGWVREHREQSREGSANVGFGIEILFGRDDPYGDG